MAPTNVDKQITTIENAVRAVLLMVHFQLTAKPRCTECGKESRLLPPIPPPHKRARGPAWVCCACVATSGKSLERTGHMFQLCKLNGHLASLHYSSWMPFWYFVVQMKSDFRLSTVVASLQALWGLSESTVYKWSRIYADILRKYLCEVDGLRVGASMNEVVSFDETTAGTIRDRTKKRPASHTVTSRKPGRTVWK